MTGRIIGHLVASFKRRLTASKSLFWC